LDLLNDLLDLLHQLLNKLRQLLQNTLEYGLNIIDVSSCCGAGWCCRCSAGCTRRYHTGVVLILSCG
jgi:hypothetical protein